MNTHIQMDKISFRMVRADEAEKVCKFGEQEMARTFKHLYKEEDFAGYIAEAYTAKKFLDWIVSPDYFVYGAFAQDDNCIRGEDIVAYVLAGPCSLPIPGEILDQVPVEEAGEVKRLYAHPCTFGSGIASRLLLSSIEWLRSGDGKENKDIFLGVYSENPRAIKFYSKHDFSHVAEYKFMVGQQADREFIMKYTALTAK